MIQGILKKVFKAREKLASHRNERSENPEAEMPFLEHLEDLRKMIVRIVATLFIALIICFAFNKTLIKIIEYPLALVEVPVSETVTNDQGEEVIEVTMTPLNDTMELTSFDPVGTFMLALKVSFLAAITISIPFLIFFILQFVLPGLRETERKLLWPAMAIGFGLFVGGVLFAYFGVVPRAMEFFYMFGVERDIDVQWTVELYSKFAVRFILIFGICFELPVVVMALVKLDILNYQFMSKRRGMALIIIFFVAAVITPTQDALTLAMLGAPMYILYEICIWLSYFMDKRDRAANPDLYAARDRIEAELAEAANKPFEWKGFGGGDDDKDENHHDDDYHHDDYHHDDDRYDPHSEGHGHGHDDYHTDLHNPDHDPLGDHDPYHGGGTRLESSAIGEDTGLPHGDDPYHHPYHPEHDNLGDYADEHQDEIDEYHRHIAEAEAAEQAALEEAKKKKSEEAESKAEPATVRGAVAKESTLEEFSARDEATSESALPSGAALGDTTGLGINPPTAEKDLNTRIRQLENLVEKMAKRLEALENKK